MIRTRSVRFLGLALGALLLTAGAAYPGDAGKTGGGYHHQTMEQRLQQSLRLTDDQMKSIREIRQRDATANQQVMQSLRQGQADLRRLALNGGDDAAIKAKTDEVARLMAQSLAARTATLRQI